MDDPVKPENKFSAFKIQWWKRHRIIIIDISILKGRCSKEERGRRFQATLKPSRANFCRFQGPVIILCGLRPCPLGPWLCPLCLWLQPWPLYLWIWPSYLQLWSHPFSPLEACICSWVILSACFLSEEFWESDTLPSFHLISVLFGPIWQSICWYNILKRSCGSPVYVLPTVRQEVLHRFYWDNPISIAGFCWESLRGSMSQMPDLFRLAEMLFSNILVILSRACFSNSLDRLRISQIIPPISAFLFTSPSLCVSKSLYASLLITSAKSRFSHIR